LPGERGRRRGAPERKNQAAIEGESKRFRVHRAGTAQNCGRLLLPLAWKGGGKLFRRGEKREAAVLEGGGKAVPVEATVKMEKKGSLKGKGRKRKKDKRWRVFGGRSRPKRGKKNCK